MLPRKTTAISGKASPRRAARPPTTAAATWSLRGAAKVAASSGRRRGLGSELIGRAGQIGDPVAHSGGVGLEQHRDRRLSRRRYGCTTSAIPRFCARNVRRTSTCCTRAIGHDRPDLGDGAVAQVDLLVSELPAPASPAQLRDGEHAHRGDGHREDGAEHDERARDLVDRTQHARRRRSRAAAPRRGRRGPSRGGRRRRVRGSARAGGCPRAVRSSGHGRSATAAGALSAAGACAAACAAPSAGSSARTSPSPRRSSGGR